MQTFVVVGEVIENGERILVCEPEKEPEGTLVLYNRQGRLVKHVPEITTKEVIA